MADGRLRGLTRELPQPRMIAETLCRAVELIWGCLPVPHLARPAVAGHGCCQPIATRGARLNKSCVKVKVRYSLSAKPPLNTPLP